MPCKKNPGGKTFGPGIGRLGELGRFLSGKMSLPVTERTEWLELCSIEINSGSLWIGDPLLANAEDGCVVKVPNGIYSIEGEGCLSQGVRTVRRIRAQLTSTMKFEVANEVGQTGTDSALIGICDIDAFDAACKKGFGDEVQEQLEHKTQAGFGRITLKEYRGAVMAFVPSGDGDGSGPVLGLLSDGTCIGLQHDFFPDAEV